MFDNHFQLNPDLVTSVGVVSGEKIPVITDRNPHLEVKTLVLGSIEQTSDIAEPCGQPPLLLPSLLGRRQHGRRASQSSRTLLHHSEGIEKDTGYLFSNLVSVHQITGGDIVVGYDRTLHKFWVVVINSVYSPESKPPDQGRGQEKLWRRLVEYQVLLIL